MIDSFIEYPYPYSRARHRLAFAAIAHSLPTPQNHRLQMTTTPVVEVKNLEIVDITRIIVLVPALALFVWCVISSIICPISGI